MKLKRRRVRKSVKVILAIGIPAYLVAFAFCLLGVNLQGDDRIYPNAAIDGVDVSRMTKAEALAAIDVQSYDARGNGAWVAIAFPDGSRFVVTGEEAKIANDARRLVDAAYSRGRGQGFFMDTVSFLQRMYDIHVLGAEVESYGVSYGLDMELLRARANAFTDEFNSGLEALRPLVYDDRIVIVKGAGQVSASGFEVFDMALHGLYRSVGSGQPVALDYYLPDAGVDTTGLLNLLDSVSSEVKSARYDPETKAVSEDATGVTFDVAGAITQLYAAESGKAVTVSLLYTSPEMTREELESLLFRDLIGECVTSIAGTQNRLNNIVLASAAIDGVVLEPGEEFSFNRIVGRRTYDKGYRLAPAFSGGVTVQANGGGICQVSSSVYSSIKDTGIHVTERHPHGKPVAYLPRGRDATVSWGTLDFKFVNSTDYPLRIDAEVDGRTLTVRVFGTVENGKLNMEN